MFVDERGLGKFSHGGTKVTELSMVTVTLIKEESTNYTNVHE